jgi:predicted transcriptional regulator
MADELTKTGDKIEVGQKVADIVVFNPKKVDRMVRNSFRKRRLLRALRKGAKTPAVLADEIRDERGYKIMNNEVIGKHLREMLGLGIVQREDKGIYSLTLQGLQLCDREGVWA